MRIDAIDGNLISPDAVQNVTNATGAFMDRNSVACAISHIKTWMTFLTDFSTEYAVIFEDDAVLDDTVDMCSAISNVAQSMTQLSIDLTLLGYYGVYPEWAPKTKLIGSFLLGSSMHDPTPINDILVRPHQFQGLHGYVISRTGADKLLSLLNADKLSMFIDAQLSHYNNNEAVTICATQMPIIHQRNDKSDLTRTDFPTLINYVSRKLLENEKEVIDERVDSTQLFFRRELNAPFCEIAGVSLNVYACLFITTSFLMGLCNVQWKTIKYAVWTFFALDILQNHRTRPIMTIFCMYLAINTGNFLRS